MVKVLVVGGGAREHAIAAALTRSPQKPEIHAVLANQNPGIMALAKDYHLNQETEVDVVASWATKKKVDFAIVGPEAPLAAGLADVLAEAGIPVASPTRAAARIESSKSFCRDLMDRHTLPGRCRWGCFTEPSEARAFIEKLDGRVALKPVGLTGGKGVRVWGDHFADLAGAMRYVEEVLRERIGGDSAIVIEEKLEGEEFTLQAFCDGKKVMPTVAVQDHKRLHEGDKGPNTGGMGAYTHADGLLPFLTASDWDEAARIVQGVVNALAAENSPYRGTIYGQFMLTAEGPKLIEINARFGDPEAMNVLAIMESDFVAICREMALGDLRTEPVFAEKATVCKYVVPRGYGEGAPLVGKEIYVDEKAVAAAGAQVYYASVNKEGAVVTTTTSRSLAVLGAAETLTEANDICEKGLAAVRSGFIHVRHDIGTKELIERRIQHMKTVQG